MDWTNLLAAGRSVVGSGGKPSYRKAERGSLPRFEAGLTGADTGLFAADNPPKARSGTTGASTFDPLAGVPVSVARPMSPLPKAGRSWLGWLFGGNRRRETGPLVQGELSLQNVRPLRNTLRDDDIALVERRQSKVIWETPAAGTTRDDQGHAWNRLRGRRLDKLVVDPD